MPQLKISDIKEELEQIRKDLNTKIKDLEGVVNELKASLEGAFIQKSIEPKDVAETIAVVELGLKQLRNDVEGHVGVYNKHIMQQHGKK